MFPRYHLEFSTSSLNTLKIIPADSGRAVFYDFIQRYVNYLLPGAVRAQGF